MGEQRSDRRRQTRDRILDAAAEIVRRHGVGAATTKRIAAEAGLSEGSLYNHFADKPQLLIALVMERLPSIRGVFESLRHGPGAPALTDRLSAALAAMIEFYSQAQPIVSGVLSDPGLLALCQRRFAETDEGPHRAHEKLGAFLAAEQQAGRLRDGVAPDMLATVLIGACTEYASLTHLTGRAPGGLSRVAYARAIVTTLVPLLAEPGSA